MLMIFSIMLFVMTITLLIMMITSMLAKKSFNDREKNSPFECGFEPKSSARIPFSLHFFLIAMIFLIFDVEITLLMPLLITIKFSKINSISMMVTLFMIILLMGVYHEWNQGTLNWTN
uniref:NADH-ubiquinone oxidoreductase chain 3 n=1 Tax=Endelus continentalis TaxID=2984121 RepID=A0A977TQ71_9COLE|nr:NADH dehydrogenase subunit 3 [Endelus continentalis]UXX50477.1 NADH dehydrogenase subunit 3 [Endelus continentalis]